MSDDKTKTGYQDRDRIALQEKHEVDYWTKRFNTTKAGLEKAVSEVGPMVKDVEEFFRSVNKTGDTKF